MQCRLSFLLLLLSSLAAGQPTTVGTAYLDWQGCYTLTTSGLSQRGAVWFEDTLDLTRPFVIDGEVTIGGSSSADGMTIALMNNPGNSIGQGGGALGYGTLSNAFAVEIDIYQNGGYNDPFYDHVAYLTNGSVIHTAPPSISAPISCLPSGGNVGQNPYPVQLYWYPSTQKLDFYFDCNLRLSRTVDLPTLLGTTQVQWGATAATGALTATFRFCKEYAANFTNDTIQQWCNGTIQPNYTAPNIQSYYWSPAIGVSDITAASPILSPPQTTTYTITRTDNCGTDRHDTLTVSLSSFDPLPPVEIICEGNSILADLTGFPNLLWSDGSASTLRYLSQPGTYYVTATDPISGCTAIDSLQLYVAELNLQASNQQVCYNDIVTLSANPPFAVYWADFDSGLPAGWSLPDTTSYLYEQMAGPFRNDTVEWNLTGLPEHDELVVEFTLYIFDDWDGNGPADGPDLWGMQVDGTSEIHTTFSNTAGTLQSYPDDFQINHPAMTNALHTGLPPRCASGATTTIYQMQFILPHSACDASVQWYGELIDAASGLLCDESWALDNVIIRTNSSSSTSLCPPAFMWSNGATATTFDTAILDTITFTYTADFGGVSCEDSITVDVLNDFVLITGLPSFLCPNDVPVSLSSPYTQGGSTFNGVFRLEETISNNVVINNTPLITIDPGTLTPGTNYTLFFEYTDPSTACSWTAEALFNVDPIPDFSTSNPPDQCINSSPIFLAAYRTWNPQNGSNENPAWYSYSTTSFGLSNALFDPALAGIGVHTITVTYQIPGGCYNTETIVVTVNDGPDLSSLFSAMPVPVCGHTSISLPVLDPLDSWSGTGVNGSAVNYTFDSNGLLTGVHTLTYTGSGHPCISTWDFEVLDPIVISFQPSPGSACLSDSTFQLTYGVSGGSGSGTSTFMNISAPGSAPILPIDNNTGIVDLSNAVPGVYTISYTFNDNNGCSASDSAQISILPLPQVDPVPNTAINLCSNGLVDLSNGYFLPSAGGTFTVNGTPLNGSVLSGSAGYLGPNANVVVYTLTDSSGCSDTAIKYFDLLEPPVITPVSGSIFTESCPGAADVTISVGVTGGATPNMIYEWSNGHQDSSLTNATAGTYTVTVTNSGGCSSEATYTVVAPNPINATETITHVSASGASDGAISLNIANVNANYLFSWSGGLPPNQNQSNLPAGTYSVTITDDNGCMEELNDLVVAQPGPLTASGTWVDVFCFGAATGSINLTVGGGFNPPDVPDYQFLWAHGATTEDLVHLAAGQYSVTVTAIPTSTDSSILNFTITEPNALTISGTTVDILCHGLNTGSIGTTVSGGVAPYSYEWNNGFTTADMTGLTAGNYMLTVTDNNLCEVEQSFVLSQPGSPFNVGANVVDVDCYGASTGEIYVTVSGATPFSGSGAPYLFTWSNGASTEDLSGVSAGMYSLTIEDANGCTTILPVLPVLQPTAPITVNGVVTHVSNFGAMDGSISLTVSGGTPGYNYGWTGPAGLITADSTVSSLNGGTYTVTVTDMNGCTQTATFVVNEPAQLTVSGTVTDETCLGSADGTIDITISANGVPAILWSNGTTIEDLSGLAVGDYSVTVVDGLQIQIDSFVIGTATILNFNLSLPNDTFCRVDTLPLQGTTTNIGAAETYKLDGQPVTGPAVPLSSYPPGQHTLTYIVSAGGCTDSTSFTFELIEGYPTVPQSSVLVCQTDSLVNLTGLLNGAAMLTLPDTGRWSDPSGNAVYSLMDPAVGPFGIYEYRISSFCGTTIYLLDVDLIQNPIIFSTPDSLCQNHGVLDLNSLVSPIGGTWSGGTTTGLFDLSMASPGISWFYYDITVTGCSFTDSTQIQVVPGPTIVLDTAALPAWCTASGTDTLDFAGPAGGSYSSTTAVITSVGGYFLLDPAASGAGNHDLWYHYSDPLSGCLDSVMATITIDTTAITAIGPFADTLCVGDLPVPLPVALPAGGVLSGTGIVGSNFSPTAAGVGTHELIYYFPSDPCYLADTIEIVVTDIPDIIMPAFSDLCSSDPAYSLNGAVPSGGTWSGSHVVNGQFLPGAAGPGVHEIVYYYNSGGNCERYDTTQITVLSGTSLSIGTVPGFCENGSAQALNVVYPAGGSYSGPGVQNNVFDPQPAGIGTHTIAYSYTDAQGCLTDTVFALVVNAFPVVTLANLPDFCEDDPPLTIMGGTPGGGTYSGPGIVGSLTFDPALAGQGSHLIMYLYTDSIGCSASATAYINVHPNPPDPGISRTLDFLVCDWGFYNYQWFFNGDSIPNSNSIKWTATDTGYYQVMLISDWGCTSISDSLLVDVIYQIGLGEDRWAGVFLYPNPVRDQVLVDLPIRPQAVHFEWINALGQVVDAGELPPGECDAVAIRYERPRGRILPAGAVG